MQSEARSQARLQQMVDESEASQYAYEVLKELSIFLRETFTKQAIDFATTYGLFLNRDALMMLEKRGLLIKTHRPKRDVVYHIDPSLVDLLQPSPSEAERHFAATVARLLRPHQAITKESIPSSLALLRWTFERSTRFGFDLADAMIRKYGGHEPRFYEMVYEIAVQVGEQDQQANARIEQGKQALRQHESALARQRFEQAVALCDQQPDLYIFSIRALERLGFMAESAKDWAQARAAYEHSLRIWEAVRRPSMLTMRLLIKLCRVTRLQGDTNALLHYSRRLTRSNWPDHLLQDLHSSIVAMLDHDMRREYFAQRVAEEISIFDWRASRLLWEWGECEVAAGYLKQGQHLCAIATVLLEHWMETHDFRGMFLSSDQMEVVKGDYWRDIPEMQEKLTTMSHTED